MAKQKSNVKSGTFGPIKRTRFPALNYQKQIDCWRFLDASTGAAIGPQYASEFELSCDLNRFAAEFGCGNSDGSAKEVHASDHPEFNAEFPERFKWYLLDQNRLSAIASRICQAIEDDLNTAERNLTPGLRSALLTIANEGTIFLNKP